MSDKVLKLIQNLNTIIVNPIIYLLMTLAVMYFIWGLVEFIWKAGNQADRDKGKSRMIWGIVGLFIMVSVYSIITISLNTFGISSTPLQQYRPGGL